MKNPSLMLYTKKIVGTILLFCFVALSCRQKKVGCDSCKMNLPDQTMLLTVGSLDSLETKIWNDDNYHFCSSRSLSDTEISYIIHGFLGLPVKNEEQEVAAVIYTNTAHDSLKRKSVQPSNVVGYSLYLRKANSFWHRFYLKGDDGTFSTISELDCETRSVSANETFSLYNIYFKKRFRDVSAIEMTDLRRYSYIIDNKLYRNNTLNSRIKEMEGKNR